MKRIGIIAGILVLSVIVMGATGRRYVGDKSYDTTVYRATYSAGQAQLEVVAAATGVSYVIDKIMFSAGAADVFYIHDSSGIVYGPVRVSTAEPFIDNEVLLKLTSESAIYVTTYVSGDITINYHSE